MGNIISFNHHVTANDDSLVMSNGLTDVLLDYLLRLSALPEAQGLSILPRLQDLH